MLSRLTPGDLDLGAHGEKSLVGAEYPHRIHGILKIAGQYSSGDHERDAGYPRDLLSVGDWHVGSETGICGKSIQARDFQAVSKTRVDAR